MLGGIFYSGIFKKNNLVKVEKDPRQK